MVLMENAGAALARQAECAASARPEAPLLALVGPGNNGGDALVAARQLHPTRATELWCPLGPPQRAGEPAEAAWEAAAALGLSGHDGAAPLLPPSTYALVLDALFGVGLTRAVRGRAADALEWVAASGVPVLAVDVPSGLDADSGAIHGTAVPAARTLTFVAAKQGFTRGEGPRLCGDVAVAGIGVSERYALDWIAARRAAAVES